MCTYIYIARAVKGTPSNQYGSVDANTPKEAKRKVKDKYTYPVKVDVIVVPEMGSQKKT
ncbi:hypothetical protein ABH909_001202 [Pseudomonas sp. BS3782 TE3695]|jgi:hypothetical protein